MVRQQGVADRTRGTTRPGSGSSYDGGQQAQQPNHLLAVSSSYYLKRRRSWLDSAGAGISRRSKTGFGIWDLPQKSTTKAKFRPLGLNRDFFGTIFGPFWDF